MYTAETRSQLAPYYMYDDDNLTVLSPTNAEQIQPIINVYDQYTGVSGLNMNVNKTTALCINTEQAVQEGLVHAGLTSLSKHFGLYLTPSLEETVTATMEHINPKALKRRILVTTLPTDILYRATLINAALLSIYNRVFMSLPVGKAHTEELDKKVLKFLWTRQIEGQTMQKRRLVARKRLAAGLAIGGVLEFSHLSILHKVFNRILNKKSTKKAASLM
jgi:hypothetical protein